METQPCFSPSFPCGLPQDSRSTLLFPEDTFHGLIVSRPQAGPHLSGQVPQHTRVHTSTQTHEHIYIDCVHIASSHKHKQTHILTCTHSAQAGVHPGTWGVRGKWESVGEHSEKAQGPACCCGGRARPHAHPMPHHGQFRELGCHSGFPDQLPLRQGSSATPAAPLRALHFSPGLTPASTGSGW